MSLYQKFRPVLFKLDPERAHHVALSALKLGLIRGPGPAQWDGILGQTIAGLPFPNPIGLAAGFDKNGEALSPIQHLGFGFMEAGTITPNPQPGNDKPRLFRLVEDQALINRFGFNSAGHSAAIKNMENRPTGIIGINIGANKDSSDRTEDYVQGVKRFAAIADYLTINISSPNTVGLRDLQSQDALHDLLARCLGASTNCPIFLKIAPDLTGTDMDQMTDVIRSFPIAGLIISNTTITRVNLTSPHQNQMGGLSGKPLMQPSTEILREMAIRLEGHCSLIGVGGIASAEDAYAKIRAGAQLIQLYTSLIYQGPGLVGQIIKGLKVLLKRDGYEHISEAVGADLP